MSGDNGRCRVLDRLGGKGARRPAALALTVALVLTLALAALFGALAAMAGLRLGRAPAGAAAAEGPGAGAGPAGPAPEGGAPAPLYVLLLGVDEREGDIGRSDTNLLVRLDPARARVGVLSLPRDTRVAIPGMGWDKLNSAYAYGGPVLAMEAVASLTGLPVDHYVRVDMAGFRQMVDLVGGIEYDVEQRMRYSDPYQGLRIQLEPGPQRLDGEQALAYLRFRGDAAGDLGRVERQQRFLKALAAQVLAPANLPRLPALVAAGARHVATNLPLDLQLQGARLAYLAQGQGIDFATVPGEGRYLGPVSYFVPDEAALRDLVARWSAGASAGAGQAG